jgi:hypothetical protein
MKTCVFIQLNVNCMSALVYGGIDGVNLMAIEPKTLLTYSVVAGRSAIIECKPTHPNVTIRLLNIGTDVTARVKFDRHKGFVISNVTPFFRGMFSCDAKMADLYQGIAVAIAYQGNGIVS